MINKTSLLMKSTPQFKVIDLSKPKSKKLTKEKKEKK